MYEYYGLIHKATACVSEDPDFIWFSRLKEKNLRRPIGSNSTAVSGGRLNVRFKLAC